MDWQKKDLQTSYKSYFSSYIEGLIKLSNSK
jgi:hypothetical protein